MQSYVLVQIVITPSISMLIVQYNMLLIYGTFLHEAATSTIGGDRLSDYQIKWYADWEMICRLGFPSIVGLAWIHRSNTLFY